MLSAAAGKGAHDAYSEKQIEELQARIRELERQNGQVKEKVCAVCLICTV